MKRIAFGLVALLGLCVSQSSGMSSVLIKPAGVVVRIGDRLYYWSDDEAPVPAASLRPKRYAAMIPAFLNEPKMPTFAKEQQVQRVGNLGGGWAGTNTRFVVIAMDSFLTVDAKGYVAITKTSFETIKAKPTAEYAPFEWQKYSNRVVYLKKKGGDQITEAVFTRPNAPDDKRYLGIGGEPLVLTDQGGKDRKFYPLMLTDSEWAARFLLYEEHDNDK